MTSSESKKWLLLIHQIPPKPNALRVKIWRRLQQIGAVAIKQSVYAMPLEAQSREDFSWTLKEIIDGGGDGSIAEARFIEGLSDEQIIASFQNARKIDYEKIITEANNLLSDLSSDEGGEQGFSVKGLSQISRMQSRLDETISIDFFHAPERGTAEILLKELKSLASGKRAIGDNKTEEFKNLKGKTWVTRGNVFVDRIACGWLIRRFVDEKAIFKFINDTRYSAESYELRFDMFDGEFTHEGDKCTFEVMIEKFRLQDKALDFIAEVVHDIDLKNAKYGRNETDGVKALLSGLVAAQSDDNLRMVEGFALFENLYAYFHRYKG
jgi:hypothetical protein